MIGGGHHVAHARGAASDRTLSRLAVVAALALCCGVVGAVVAQDAPPDTLPGIGLHEFLSTAYARHPLFAGESLRPRIASSERRELAAAQDWGLEARSAWQYGEPITATPFAPSRTEGVTLSAGLGREVWRTGGRVTLDWRGSWLEQDLAEVTIPTPEGPQAIETGPGTLYRNLFTLRYTQPLWRNRGGDLDRIEVAAAGHRVDVAALAAAEAQEAFLLELALGYIDWARWEATLEVARDRLSLAREQGSLVSDLRERNLVDRADLLRSEATVAVARRQLTMVRAERDGARAGLATLARMDGLERRSPAYRLRETVALPDPAMAFARLDTTSRQLRQVEARSAEMREYRDGAAGRADPTLDLNLEGALKGGDRAAYGPAWDLQYPDAGVALVFRQALGTGAAEAAREGAELQLRRLDHERHRAAVALEAALADELARLRGYAEALDLNRVQVEAAARQAEAEREAYRQGRNQLNFVLQAQDAEEAARRAWIDAAARYHGLLMRYRELTDTLLIMVDGAAGAEDGQP